MGETDATGVADERLYDERYERYGRPLEREHAGEYLAISPSGATILGPTLLDVTQRAAELFGPGSFVYKVGARSVGKWR
jgi:hypothetical protein